MARIIKSIFNSNAILGDTEEKRRQSMMAAAGGAQSQPYNQFGGAAAGLIGARLRQEFFPTMEEEASEIGKDILKRVSNNPMFNPNKSPFASKQVILDELTEAYRETNNTAILKEVIKGSSQLAAQKQQMQNSFLEGQIKTQDLALRTIQLEEAEAKQGARITGRLFEPEKVMAAENTLRTEFGNRFEDYSQRRSAVSAMKSLAKQNSIGADIQLIVNYFKAGDPNSAVLTGEADLAQTINSLGGKLLKAYNKLIQGEMLSDPQRVELINAAATRYNENAMELSSYIDNLILTANNRGLNPDNIITDKVLGIYDYETGEFLERNVEIPTKKEVQEEIVKQKKAQGVETIQDLNLPDDYGDQLNRYGVGNDNALLFDQVDEEEDEFGGIV